MIQALERAKTLFYRIEIPGIPPEVVQSIYIDYSKRIIKVIFQVTSDMNTELLARRSIRHTSFATMLFNLNTRGEPIRALCFNLCKITRYVMGRTIDYRCYDARDYWEEQVTIRYQEVKNILGEQNDTCRFSNL